MTRGLSFWMRVVPLEDADNAGSSAVPVRKKVNDFVFVKDQKGEKKEKKIRKKRRKE